MQAQTVAIIGLNRLGASVGLALKESPLELEIVGHDRNSNNAKAAKLLGAISNNKWSMGKTAAAADILVLAVTPSEQERVLGAIGGRVREHTLIMDLSGAKADGAKWAKLYLEEGYYVGARLLLAADKLADGRTETSAAQADLFHNSVLTLSPGANLDPKAVSTAVAFGRLLGAAPYFIDAHEFDSFSQGVETIPTLIAAAMFNSVHQAGGWRDMLRFAGQPFAQTVQPLQNGADIAPSAIQNGDATLRWLDALLTELTEVRRWVADGEVEILSAFLEDLDLKREKWLRDRSKNDWAEDDDSVEVPSMMQHLFGSFAGPRKDRS